MLAENDDAGGPASQLVFTPAASGDFLAVVSGFFSGTGSYELVIEPAAPDDHGDNASGATTITVPGLASGVIELIGDRDFFSFEASAGSALDISTVLGTLADSTLAILDADGVTQLAFNDDSSQGLASRITFVPPTTDTYFAVVAGFPTLFGEGLGSYQLAIEEASGSPDETPSFEEGPFTIYGDCQQGSGAVVSGALAPDGTVVTAWDEAGQNVGQSEILDCAWEIDLPTGMRNVYLTVGDSVQSDLVTLTAPPGADVPEGWMQEVTPTFRAFHPPGWPRFELEPSVGLLSMVGPGGSNLIVAACAPDAISPEFYEAITRLGLAIVGDVETFGEVTQGTTTYTVFRITGVLGFGLEQYAVGLVDGNLCGYSVVLTISPLDDAPTMLNDFLTFVQTIQFPTPLNPAPLEPIAVSLDLAARERQVALAEGWSLVGWTGATPVREATASLGDALLGAFTWDATGQTFLSFNPVAPSFINTLTDLTLGDGVWINLSEATIWPQPPFAEARDVTLEAGFNLVMWTGPDDTLVTDALASIASGLEGLFIWDASAQAYLVYRPTAPAFLNTATTLSFGDGVWLLMTQAATWSQPAIGAVIVHSDTFNAIASRGTIRIGVLRDSNLDAIGEFELALGLEIVARLFGAINVDRVPVSAADRFAALQDGTIDLLIRTTTHTTSREERFAPTSNYFLDGLRVTVPTSSGINSLADLDGLTLAVMLDTTFEARIRATLADEGVAVEFVSLDNLNTALDLLDSGQVDGLGWSYSFAITQERDDLTAISVSMDDPWALWTASPDFRDEVEVALLALIEDGTWEALFSQAFGFDAPWTIKEMLAVPPEDR